MTDFLDLADGGRAVAALLAEHAGVEGVVVLGVVPNGVPGALEVARALGLPLLGVEVDHDDGGISGIGLPDLTGVSHVIVVDDAVETGTAATAIGRALRQAAPHAFLTLAVPVCPREASATLDHLFDRVVAVVRPLARRSLTWHYATFAPVGRGDALALIASHSAD